MGKIKKCNGDCFNCQYEDCIADKDREKTREYWRDYRKKHKEQYKKYEHTRYVKNHADEMCRRRLKAILEMKGRVNDDRKSI